MDQGPNSIFNLPITENDDNTYAWSRYQCDCSSAEQKGKFHRPYTGATLDTHSFCFGPTNDSDIQTAMRESPSEGSCSSNMAKNISTKI